MRDQLAENDSSAAGGEKRPRRRMRMPSGHALLACLSVALAVVSVLAYVSAAPTLLSTVDEVPVAQQESAPDGDASSQGEAAPEEKGEKKDEEADKDEKDGEKDAGAASADVDEFSAEATDEEDGSEKKDSQGQGSKGDGTDESRPSQRPSGDSNENAEPDSSDDTVEADPDNVFTSTPTAQEEEETRAYFAGWLSQLHGYLSQANGVAQTFESTCLSSDLSTRRSNYGSCDALCQQLFNGYIAVRDRPTSNNSQYKDEQGRLIGAYRCLYSYVLCYRNAWRTNVTFEDPSAHESEFRGSLSSSEGYLSEFYSYYQGLSI